MVVYKFIISVLLLHWLGVNFALESSDDEDTDPCEMLLKSFAYASGNFTYCAISSARPIRLCQLCFTKYSQVREVYNDINNLDPTGGQLCKDKLFNLDRLQVVDSGFKYVTTLWKRAKCESCYTLNSGKEEEQLKPDVIKMLNISDQFETCVKAHRNESTNQMNPDVCQDCQPDYHELNHQYNVLKGPSGEDDICMDIVDLVNRTRLDWSTSLGCYVYKKKVEVIYLVLTGIVTLIPVAFYFFTWCLITKKQQLVSLQNNVPDYLKQIHRRASSSVFNR